MIEEYYLINQHCSSNLFHLIMLRNINLDFIINIFPLPTAYFWYNTHYPSLKEQTHWKIDCEPYGSFLTQDILW